MNMPCPCRVDCPGTDTPVANLTSEPPDRLIFIGYSWGWDLNVPRLGWNFGDPINNPSFCDSTVSQDDAQQCADRNQVGCLSGDCGPGDTGPSIPWTDQSNRRIQTFLNAAAFCTVHCADGLPFTYTVKAGLFRSFSQQQADEIAISYACQQANLNAVCFGSITGACLGQNYLSVISVTGGFAPYSIVRIGGVLPPGVGFVQDTGTTAFLSGIPTVTGAFTFTVRAVDTKGNFMQKNFTVNVLDISNKASIPQPSVGTFYNFQLAGVGGVAPYTFSNATGLPGGLTLQSDGFIVGNPIAPIGTGFSCVMTDAVGNACSFPLTYSPCSFFQSIVWDVPVDNNQHPINHVPPNSGSATVTYPKTPDTSAILVTGSCIIINPFADVQTSVTQSGLVLTKGFTGNCQITLTAAMVGAWQYEVFVADPTFTTIYFDTGFTNTSGNLSQNFSFAVPNIPQIAVSILVSYGNNNVSVNTSGTFRVDFGT